jgi:hypothetical protein
MASLIRQIVEAIAEHLRESEYFRTVPTIPVLVEDQKNVENEIVNAAQKTGAFVLVNFVSGETDSENTPGPYLSTATFQVTVSEIPSLWRSKVKPGPSCTEIAEAVARLLHHVQPADRDDVPLSGGVLLFAGMTQQVNDSMLQQAVQFTIPIGLPNEIPTR